MKGINKIILFSLLAVLAIGLSAMGRYYYLLQQQLKNAAIERTKEITSDITALARNNVITGNLYVVYNYVEKIAHARNIVHFDVEAVGQPTGFARSIAKNNLPPTSASFVPLNDNGELWFDDVKNKIWYIKIPLFADNEQQNALATLLYGISYEQVYSHLNTARLWFVLTVVLMIFCVCCVVYIAARIYYSHFERVLDYFSKISLHKRTIKKPNVLSEFRPLVEKVEIIAEVLEENECKTKRIVEDAALGKIATQVAHDIRGPLSSMQTAVGYFGEMKVEDEKFGEVLNLLQLSAKRLTSIADGLLQKHKGVEDAHTVFSLYKVLDELVGEYNSQYPAVKFNKEYASQAVELHGNFAKLQRAFGNIIKNAIEAMQFAGNITLRTELKNNNVVVSISDTGPGMLPEKLQKVLNGGYTEGKKDGNGIGMTVVRETVKEHGGEVTASSEVGKGTAFFIVLPLLDKDQVQIIIQVEENKPVIVIDDDVSLREQWRLILQEQEKQTLLCDSYENFQSQKITPAISPTVVVDYHYDNSELNGGDVIQRLQAQEFTNLYLCTAEYWKPSVQKLAQELHVTLCPKPLPKIVIARNKAIMTNALQKTKKLSSGGRPGYNVLVIDDDPSIQMSWDVMQEKLGITRLYCYSSMEEMQSNGVDLKNIDIAFVDKNIEGSAFTGADVIAFLKTHCAGKIILASGENEQILRQDPQFAQADFVVQDKIPSSLSKFLI